MFYTFCLPRQSFYQGDVSAWVTYLKGFITNTDSIFLNIAEIADASDISAIAAISM